MKKAEDYIIERETDHWADQDYSKSDIIRWIKQAQIDAIEEAVKRCAENAQIDFIDLTSDRIFDYSECLLDDDVNVIINKESIFSVAEQLKKELE